MYEIDILTKKRRDIAGRVRLDIGDGYIEIVSLVDGIEVAASGGCSPAIAIFPRVANVVMIGIVE